MQIIHDEGVIHNDLKPENFVCIGARLKLIDFGIANRIEAEKTSIERDIRCGTINYMAPETIEANDISDRFKVLYCHTVLQFYTIIITIVVQTVRYR